MRVAYLDLGFSREQYGLHPTRYGGGGVVARYLKEDPEIDFHVYAPIGAFDNVGKTERRDRCFGLLDSTCEALAQGRCPLGVIGGIERYDIILHGHTCFAPVRGILNTPVVHFCGFDGSAGHPGNHYVLFYDDSFKPQFGEHAKYVRIGKPVPDVFVERAKEDFIFQCSRHDDHMNSIQLAKICLEHGIKGIFAGPIHNGYPLMQYIDGKTTVYLGEIDEVAKMDYHSRARLCGLLANWELPFNQSIIEAQGVGTPILVNQVGPFLKNYLREGVNGWAYSPATFRQAFDFAHIIKQKDCWAAAREYDVSVMCESFKKAFREIVTEWNILRR